MQIRGTGARRPYVLITKKKATKQHDDYVARIREIATKPEAGFKMFDVLIKETNAFPAAMARVDTFPTYAQKYPPQIGAPLLELATEVQGAFNELNV